MSDADLVIRGGLVVDGTGGPPVEADVAVDGGRVVAVGDGLSGRAELDAAGCVVAPGFIDVHTHYDAQVTWDAWLTPSSWLGVTSVIAGNCGFSLAPCRPDLRRLMMRTLEAVEDMSFAAMDSAIPWSFETYPEYVDAQRRRGVGINFGGYVGHTAVRLWAMGDDAYSRQARPDEIERMADVVRGAIAGGAVGFSSDRAGFLQGDGGRPVPSVVASPAETEALIMAVAEAGRGIVHVAPGDNFEWIYELAPRYGRTFTWSAILAYPDDLPRPVTWRDKLGRHLQGRRDGLDVHVQVTSRVLTFQFTMLNPLTLYGFPSIAALDRDDRAARVASFRDPSWRETARREMDRPGLSWTRMTVAETTQPGVAGRSIADLAAERGVHPLDAILDVALADDLATRYQVVAANGDDESVARLLTGDGCVLGLSDAGAHIGQLCDAVMPLDYLSRWVRDRDLVPLEAGIHKLTGELAAMLGLTDRGVLRPGAWADVVVLEWDDLGPGPTRRVRDLPGGEERLVADQPTGLRHVLVNGVPIRQSHEPRTPDRLPGMLLGPKRYDP
jgi:N-acyl-D-aspartate/D-glutamate deacylase